MAVSAFKSTSRRGNTGTGNTTTSSSSSSNIVSKGGSSDNLDKKVIHRRSRSVSATSRIQNSTSFDDFVHKRDNPLFSSSPPDVNESKKETRIPNVSKLDNSPSKMVENGVDSRRGRSVSRSSNSSSQIINSRKAMGQSLSRLDTGRRHRSVSRVRREDSESEIENKYSVSSTMRSKTIGNSRTSVKKSVSVITSDSEQSSRTRKPQTWSSQHPLSEPSDNLSSCSQADYREDATSTSSFSEAEEKTILAVTQQMKSFQSDLPAGDVGRDDIYETVRSEVKRALNEIQGDLENAIQRKNLTSIAKTNVSDIPPELVNPDAIELVSEIRSEYGSKLKQSQERARRLRADLAVEEHREQEFSRILEEILPEPKNLERQKSRPRRKTSTERRKMSKRLAEEALNYFDECVSISTFDGSDFSSVDDPPSNLPMSNLRIGDHRFPPSTINSASTSYYVNSLVNNNEEIDEKFQSVLGHDDAELLANSDIQDFLRTQDISTDSTGALQDRKFHFSLAHEPKEIDGIRQEMGNFIKMFEKDDRERVVSRSSYCDGDFWGLSFPDERLLFDKVVLRNRIDSGGVLFCDTWT